MGREFFEIWKQTIFGMKSQKISIVSKHSVGVLPKSKTHELHRPLNLLSKRQFSLPASPRLKIESKARVEDCILREWESRKAQKLMIISRPTKILAADNVGRVHRRKM